jgi:hypothetical protein
LHRSSHRLHRRLQGPMLPQCIFRIPSNKDENIRLRRRPHSTHQSAFWYLSTPFQLKNTRALTCIASRIASVTRLVEMQCSSICGQHHCQVENQSEVGWLGGWLYP